MTRYWNILINMNDNKLTKQVFIYHISKSNSNWTINVKSILNATNHKSVFDNHTHVIIIMSMTNVCQILMKGGNWV